MWSRVGPFDNSSVSQVKSQWNIDLCVLIKTGHDNSFTKDINYTEGVEYGKILLSSPNLHTGVNESYTGINLITRNRCIHSISRGLF